MAEQYKLWPEFNGTKAVSIPRGNGSEYIVFGDDASAATAEDVADNLCNDMTRVIHQKIGGRAILCGTYVNRNDRGGGLGLELIDYFIENAPNVTGEFGGTSLIHKPIFAVQLGRMCLYPVDSDFLVGIPRTKEARPTSDVPHVVILKDSVTKANRWRVKQKAGRHRFYNVIDDTAEKEVTGGPLHKTFLHTKFTR